MEQLILKSLVEKKKILVELDADLLKLFENEVKRLKKQNKDAKITRVDLIRHALIQYANTFKK